MTFANLNSATHARQYAEKDDERAGIQPYLTNHSLRATTVTVLSASKSTVNDQRSTISSKCRQPLSHSRRKKSMKFSSTVCLMMCKGRDVIPLFSSSPDRGLPLGTQNQNFLSIFRIFCQFTFNVNVNNSR